MRRMALSQMANPSPPSARLKPISERVVVVQWRYPKSSLALGNRKAVAYSSTPPTAMSATPQLKREISAQADSHPGGAPPAERGQFSLKPKRKTAALANRGGCFGVLGAGAGFEPATFRL